MPTHHRLTRSAFLLGALLLSAPWWHQAAAQTPRPVERYWQVFYDAPFDATTRLRIREASLSRGGRCCSSVLNVELIDQTDSTRRWLIDSIAEPFDYVVETARIEPGVIVLRRFQHYGFEAPALKLFLDSTGRRLVRRIAFDVSAPVRFPADSIARRVLGVSTQGLRALRTNGMLGGGRVDSLPRPELFTRHPLPQSTWDAFAVARPARAASGYLREFTDISEQVGGWFPADDGGYWFGKSFYDAEGTSGVGAIGMLDRVGRYTLLDIPQVVPWSVDVLLVEPDVLWASLTGQPEGANYAGGLLQYDRSTGRSTVHPVSEVIRRIVRVEDALFLDTAQGLFVLRNGRVTWHHMEPDRTGRMVVVSEEL